MEAIKDALTTAVSPKTREVAKGALWTLGKAGDAFHCLPSITIYLPPLFV